VLQLTYNDKHFLFMGDAEREVEEEILAREYDVSADVLKVGHHGSSSSSTKRFIETVKPSYAIISVGTNNHTVIRIRQRWIYCKTYMRRFGARMKAVR